MRIGLIESDLIEFHSFFDLSKRVASNIVFRSSKTDLSIIALPSQMIGYPDKFYSGKCHHPLIIPFWTLNDFPFNLYLPPVTIVHV